MDVIVVRSAGHPSAARAAEAAGAGLIAIWIDAWKRSRVAGYERLGFARTGAVSGADSTANVELAIGAAAARERWQRICRRLSLPC